MEKVKILKNSRWSLGGNIVDIKENQTLECTEAQAQELIAAGFASEDTSPVVPGKKAPVENKTVTEDKAPAKKAAKN